MVIGALEILPPGILLGVAAGSLLIAGVASRLASSTPLVLCTVVLVSAARYTVSSAPLSGASIDRLGPRLPMAQLEVVGRVLRDPVCRYHRPEGGGLWTLPYACEGVRLPSGGYEPCRVGTDRRAVRGVRHQDASQVNGIAAPPPEPESSTWKRCRGRIQVSIRGAGIGEALRSGQQLRFTGTLQKKRYPGGESMELVVTESDPWCVLAQAPRFSPSAWGQRWRRAAARRLGDGINRFSDQLAVYRALLLGYRTEVPGEIHRQFKRTGTLHIFAISGLHVGIMALLLTVVLKTIGLPRNVWGVWLLPLLGGYVWVTGMKTSALRALTMAAVFFLAPLFRRRPDIPVSIAFAALLLLWWKPTEIISAGFIFSFTVVSFIVMLFSATPRHFIFRGAGKLRDIRAYAVSLIMTSLAAFIASAPVTALFFGTFSPVSLAGNLIVVPLTFCIVLSGWLSILIPPASGIFNHAALVFIDLLLGSVGLFSRLPGACIRVPPPPLTALLFWYAGWIALFTHARGKRERRAACMLIGLAVVLALLHACQGSKSAEGNIHFERYCRNVLHRMPLWADQ